MTDTESKAATRTAKVYIVLILGALAGLTIGEPPTDLFMIVGKLFFGAFIIACTSLVMSQACDGWDSDGAGPSWTCLLTWLAITWGAVFVANSYF